MNAKKNPSAPAEKPKPRRRWLKALLIVLILLAVLIATLPYLLSWQPLTGLAVGIANGYLPGRVELDDLSTGWGGPTTLRGLRVYDPSGRLVLSTDSVRAEPGVWSAINSTDYGSVTVAGSQAVLYLDETGQPSIVRAFPQAEPKAKKAEPTQLAVWAILQDSTVVVVQPDGRRLEVTNVNLTAGIDKANRTVGQLSLTLAGGTIDGNWDLQLPAGDRALPTGGLKMTIQPQLAIEPLSDFAGLTGPEQLFGRAGGQVDLKLVDGGLGGRIVLAAQDLRSGAVDAQAVQPLNVKMTADFDANQTRMTGAVKLTGDFIRSQWDFRYMHGTAPEVALPADATALLFDGQPIHLPEFALDGDAVVNLVRLAEAVPAALRLLPGVALQRAEFRISQFRARGGARPSVDIDGRLTTITATRNGEPIRVQPVSFALAGRVDPNAGLALPKLKVESAFAAADANGTPQAMSGRVSLSLPKLHEQLGQIVDLTGVPRQGRLDLGFAWEGLEIGRGGEQFALARLRVTGPAELDANDVLVRLGTTPSARGGFQLTGELAELADAARPFLPAEQARRLPKTIRGRIDIRGRARTEGQVVGGTLSGSVDDLQLRKGGRQFAQQRIAFAAKGRLDRGKDVLTLDANAASAALAVGFDGQVRRLLNPPASAMDIPGRGSFHVIGDLGQIATAVRSFLTEQEQAELPDELAGRLDVRGQGRSNVEGLAVNVNGAIDSLRIRRDQVRFEQDRVTVDANTRLDRSADRLAVDANIAAPAFALALDGHVARLNASPTLDLAGPYRGQWEQIMALLYTVEPGLRDKVRFTGTTAGQVRIAGPISQPQVSPSYAGLDANTQVGWDGGEILGIRLGVAKLLPRLAGGLGQLPLAEVPVQPAGRLRLGGTVDLSGPAPVYRLPGKVNIIENVPLNTEIGTELLSHINPVFAKLTNLTGEVSLATEDIVMPLGADSGVQGHGRGRLDFKEVTVAPSGLLGALLRTAGMATGENMKVQFSGTDFVIRENRIHYDNFRMIFPGDFDLGFSGSVGFDDTLALDVSVPVHQGLLRRLGVPAATLEKVKQYAPQRVTLPIRGTRLSASTGSIKLDVKELIAKAVQNMAADRLKDLAASRPSQLPGLGPATRPADGNRPASPLDGIRDILRGAGGDGNAESSDGNAGPRLPLRGLGDLLGGLKTETEKK